MPLQVFSAFRVFHREGLLPIFPIAILDAQGDGRANRLPVPHARENFGLVFLHALTSAATVTQLSPVEFTLDESLIDRQSGRQS
jgi:hypothetical protein